MITIPSQKNIMFHGRNFKAMRPAVNKKQNRNNGPLSAP
jgi:hypothetical protein